MKNFITPTYTFTPGASGVGTVNLSGISGFNIKNLVSVINQTRGVIIYATGLLDKRFTNVAGTTVTLFFDTTGQNAADVLQVIYETPDVSKDAGATDINTQRVIAATNSPEVINTTNLNNTIVAEGATQPSHGQIIMGHNGAGIARHILVDANGRQVVNVNSSALPTGAATETTLAALNTKVTAVDTGAVTVTSSVLPTGAATETTLAALNTKVATETTLAALNTKVTAVNTGDVTVASSVLPTGAATETTLAALNTKVTAVNTGAVVISSSALPSGASTSANQTAANVSLASIDTKTPTLDNSKQPVIPSMTTGGNISVQTAATGTNWTAFASQALKQLTVSNQTGTSVEFRQGGAGVGFIVPNGSIFTFFGITNANQIEARRVDTSNTQVTVTSRWES